MFSKKSFLRRLFGSFLSRSSRDAAYFRKRSLQLESLEAREMLSGDGLDLPLDSQDTEESSLILPEPEEIPPNLTASFELEALSEDTDQPSQIWIDKVDEPTEGVTSGRFILKRDNTIGSLRITYSLSGTASNNTDYEYLQNFVFFVAGEDTAYVNVVPHDDHLVEPTKTVILTLRDATVTNGILPYTVDETKRSATLNLSDNEVSPHVWIAGVEHATEGETVGRIILKRDTATHPLDIYYNIGGTSSQGSDYEYLSDTVTFAAGEDTVYVNIIPHDDHLVEATETVTLTLRDASSPNGRLLYTVDESKRSITLNLYDNEVSPLIWIDGVVDTTEGVSKGRFTIKRDNATDPLTIRYSLSGTASNNTDYEYLYNYVTFAAGEDTVYVNVVPHDDHQVEAIETVILTLQDASSPNGRAIYSVDSERRSMTLNLSDNEVSPHVWIAGVEHATEGETVGRIILKRDTATHPLDIYYNIGGTSSQGSDYEYLSDTVTFAAGEDTVYVNIIPHDDHLVEATETVTLTLRDASSPNGRLLYTVDESKRSTTLNLYDNEVSPLIWIDNVVDTTEGVSKGRFSIKRDNTTDPLTIRYSLSGTASNNTDYEYLYNYVTFAAGEDTVYVNVVPHDDHQVEAIETVILTLQDASSPNGRAIYTVDSERRSMTLNLSDNEVSPHVWIAGVEHATEGETVGRIILKRDTATHPLDIYYNIGGTSSQGSDYEYLSDTVTFAAGEDTVYVNIIPHDDHLVEATETVTLTLRDASSPNGRLLYTVDESKRSTTLNLYDNEVSPLIWIDGVVDTTEGVSKGRFSIKRDNTTDPLTIRYSLSGTASNNTDYEYLYNYVTFAAGEDTVYVNVVPHDDHQVEAIETVILTLQDASSPNGRAIYTVDSERRSMTLNLSDNEVSPHVWVAGVEHATEGETVGRIILKRDTATHPLDIYYNIGGTSSQGSDYEYLSDTVTFAAGEDTVYVNIIPHDDHLIEATETVTLTLRDASSPNGRLLYTVDESKRSITLNLYDNEVSPLIWIDNVVDTIEGVSKGRFSIKRDNTTDPLTIRYSLSGTASNNTDYEYLSGSVTFAAGEDIVYVNIVPYDDHLVELTETIILSLRDATITNGILPYTVDETKRSATLNLSDNEVSPHVWIAGVEHATEGETVGRIILKRDTVTHPLDIYYNISGTSSQGSDYEYLSDTVTFAAGEDTVYVNIIPHDDHLVEATETVTLTLRDASSPNGRLLYTVDESKRSTTLNLYDNEVSPLIWIDNVVDTTEGVSKGRFSIKRDNATDPLTIRYSVSGTASNNTDYEYLSGSVTFAAGEDTVYVNIIPHDDHLVESTETIILALRDATLTNGILPYTVDETRRSATLNLFDTDLSSTIPASNETVWIAGSEDAIEGVSNGRFILKRSDTTRALTVRYSVSGTASNNTDYDNLYGSVTFAEGEDTAYIAVQPKDDLNVENTETIILTLSTPTTVGGVAQYALDPEKSSATLNLIDNDIAPLVWFAGLKMQLKVFRMVDSF